MSKITERQANRAAAKISTENEKIQASLERLKVRRAKLQSQCPHAQLVELPAGFVNGVVYRPLWFCPVCEGEFTEYPK